MARIYHTWHGFYPSTFTGILDAYPGASIAYSLRRLSSSYTGPVVQARRLSDNATLDFMAAEIIDGTLLTWAGGGSVTVSTWYDQSGNTQDITSPSAANELFLVESGVLVAANGRPSLRSPSTDYMELLSPSMQTGAGARMDLFVGFASDANERPAFSYGNAIVVSGGKIQIAFLNRNVILRVDGGNYTTSGNLIYDFALSKLNIIQYSVPSGAVTFSDSLFHVNNVLASVSLGVSISTGNTLPLRIASNSNATQYFDGYISEYIHWPNDQSSNQSGIASNVNTHYTIY